MLRRVYFCPVGDYFFPAEHSDPLDLESFYSDPWDRKCPAAVCLAEFGPASWGYWGYYARTQAMKLRS